MRDQPWGATKQRLVNFLPLVLGFLICGYIWGTPPVPRLPPIRSFVPSDLLAGSCIRRTGRCASGRGF